MTIPAWLVGFVPGIAGIVIAFLGWQAALYTKRHAHDRTDS